MKGRPRLLLPKGSSGRHRCPVDCQPAASPYGAAKGRSGPYFSLRLELPLRLACGGSTASLRPLPLLFQANQLFSERRHGRPLHTFRVDRCGRHPNRNQHFVAGLDGLAAFCPIDPGGPARCGSLRNPRIGKKLAPRRPPPPRPGRLLDSKVLRTGRGPESKLFAARPPHELTKFCPLVEQNSFCAGPSVFPAGRSTREIGQPR